MIIINKKSKLIAKWMLNLFLILLLSVLSGKSFTYASEILAPTAFEWSGGSGRLKGMNCLEIYQNEEETSALLEIRSENYIYIKVNGIQYDRLSVKDGKSIFKIPIILNEEMPIIACTNAMSTEHEIEYTICVQYDEAQVAVVEKKDLEESAQDSLQESEEDYVENLHWTDESWQEEVPVITGLTLEKKLDLQFAKEFNIYYYNDGYKVISVHNDRQFLIIPEGAEIPADLPGEMEVLYQPLQNIYLAATAAMALFDSIDSLDAISLSSIKASDWYIENAAEAMKEDRIQFAGKYSEPDYELLIGADCSLAIESTMILHSPKVQEMLEDMGIPVFIDHSSYEEHPLGRTEWVKLYGALLNKEEEANHFFAEQAKIIETLKDFKNTEQTVAFFYISSDGSVVVRTAEDYVPRMIEIAGGRYLFDYITNEESKKSSANLTMEEFYATAIDADYLVYNATIDDPISTMDDLLQKDVLFSDFKAVQNGNVWCAGKYLYQATDIVGNMITDLHIMLTNGDDGEMTFLTHIQ